MKTLGVNIDHVATLRQARLGNEPDPVTAAFICEMAGADAITVHLREDRRHIQENDVRILKTTLQTRLNLEMAATEELLALALEIEPYSCTLVPEKREELTTEGGLDVKANFDKLKKIVRPLVEHGIIVSIFVDPAAEQIELCKTLGAQFIELHTGKYAEAFNKGDEREEFENLYLASEFAHLKGLGVNAGHGLNYNNVKNIVKIKHIQEFNIGHSIISKAVFSGLDKAVREMKDLLS